MNMVVSFCHRKRTNYCKTFEFNNFHGSDGPITCHLEEVNRDQTVTGLI